MRSHLAQFFRRKESTEKNALTVVVSLHDQTLGVWLSDSGQYIKKYRASTAKNGPGELENSYCTPRGHLQITSKIGADCPPNTFFVARVPVSKDQSEGLDITARILRLKGLQPGFNAEGNRDTFNRYIYIHGISAASPIPERNSKGCITLSRENVIDLFETVKEKTQVTVYEQTLPSFYVRTKIVDRAQLLPFFSDTPHADWFVAAYDNNEIVGYVAVQRKNITKVDTLKQTEAIEKQLMEMQEYFSLSREYIGY